MDAVCLLMGRQTSEQGATIPTVRNPILYTVLSREGRVVDMASSDGEGVLPTSPSIHHTFFEHIMAFLYFKERSHMHIFMFI